MTKIKQSEVINAYKNAGFKVIVPNLIKTDYEKLLRQIEIATECSKSINPTIVLIFDMDYIKIHKNKNSRETTDWDLFTIYKGEFLITTKKASLFSSNLRFNKQINFFCCVCYDDLREKKMDTFGCKVCLESTCWSCYDNLVDTKCPVCREFY